MYIKRMFIISILLTTLIYIGNYGIAQSYTTTPSGDLDSEYYLNDYQEFDANTYNEGIRSLNFDDFPVDWFELDFINYPPAEVYELSMLSIIDDDVIQDSKAVYNINPLNRSKLISVTEQLINASYGFVHIKRYEFLNDTELNNFLRAIEYYPHYFRNTYYKDNILFDIDYDDRHDFRQLADLLELDGIETAKLTLSNYPLPFKFLSERINDNSTKPSFLPDFEVSKNLTQRYEYDDDIITVNYYLIDGFDIAPFRRLVFMHSDEEFLLGTNVLIHIINNTHKIWIDFPEGLIARSENLDS